ncbi:MAG: amino acid adenylation domain-containing protein, partial [Pseudomonas sp.]|nr:amino acid adenylation domain-containing protein [Pseudomonas sp.]
SGEELWRRGAGVAVEGQVIATGDVQRAGQGDGIAQRYRGVAVEGGARRGVERAAAQGRVAADNQGTAAEQGAAAVAVAAIEHQGAAVELVELADAGQADIEGCRGTWIDPHAGVATRAIDQVERTAGAGQQAVAIGDELQAIDGLAAIDGDVARRALEHRKGAAPGGVEHAVEVGPVGVAGVPHASAAIDLAVGHALAAVPELDVQARGADQQVDLVGQCGLQGHVAQAHAQRQSAEVQAVVGQGAGVVEDAVHTVAEAADAADIEREELLETFNQTPGIEQPHGPLHRRIEAVAQVHPHALAATANEQSLTYQHLNQRANALAHHLIDLGVRPDDRVAVFARRGLDTLIGLVAVLKAGAGYVPVDPGHPDERVRYLLDDSAPVAVLTQHGLRGRLGGITVPVLVLDQPDWPQRLDDPVVALGPEHLAYVIYTSGSTGQPKGVMVEHRTLNNLVDWHCRAFDLCLGRHTSSLAGFGFDAMAWEVWPALCAGATLHLAPAGEGHEDLDALLAWWREQPLDISFLPTPVAEYAFSHQLGHPTLRTLLIGGDRLRQFNRTQTFAVVNNYGPTETTVVASSGVLEAGGALHIGGPVDNARLYVLDAGLQPVPLGVAGELYIGGAGVARGYLGRPQLTAERFLDDPFSATQGARMYRTGDLVRWLADGTLDYLGRNDDQVKIRGVRIELGEIENRLNSLPGIGEAVVVAREDQPGQPRLVAYFTAQAGFEAPLPEQLRTQLLAHLPEYMVPVAFVALQALPLTANGKLDRRALPAPERSALFERGYVAPEGELERALAQLWAELLQVEQVGRHDHFFALGGHSLLAMAWAGASSAQGTLARDRPKANRRTARRRRAVGWGAGIG